MSEFSPDEPGKPDWEKMLRAVLGDAAAEEMLQALHGQGINPGALPDIFSNENFTLITQQIQQMLGSSGAGAVNWNIAEKVARERITQQKLDKLTAGEAEAARQALRAASLWLDAASEINPLSGPNMAWTRLDWIAHSLPTFKRLLDPVGENIARAFGESFTDQIEYAPEEMRNLLPNTDSLLQNITASMLGMQYGSALADLAASSFGSTDTGLPLTEGSTAALVPANIAEFSKDLEVPASEILSYIAVREVAAARLYTGVPWLRARVLDTVAEFAQGIEIDTSAIEDKIRDISLDNPQAIQEIDLDGIFSLGLSPAQEDALERLEHLLSLIEGWVSEVSARAVAPHLPNAVPLREMFNRRYATDNPAKHVWEAQLGMEMAPRQLRNSITFWQMAEHKLGIAERDALWQHPDLLPTAADLTDPESFFAQEKNTDIEAELDSFLADLFSENPQNTEEVPHEPKFMPPTSPGAPGAADAPDNSDSSATPDSAE